MPFGPRVLRLDVDLHERDYVVARFQLSDTTEFKRWILGFGQCARVMQPKALAEEIARELAAARDGYGDVLSADRG